MFANKAAAERAKADLFEALKKAVKKYIEQNVNRPEPVHWSEDLGLQATTLSILRHEVNVSVFFKSGDERAHKVWDFLCSLPLSEVHSIAESIAPGLNHESKCKIFIKQLLAQLGLLNIVFHSPTIPQFYNATAFLRDSDLPDMALAVLQGVSHLPAALPVEAPPPFERSESVLSPTLDSLSSPTTTSPAPAAAAAAAPAAAPAPAAIPTPPAAPAPALVPTPAPASVAMSAGTARSLSLAGPDSPAPFNDEVIVVRRKVHRQGTKDKPRKPKATRTESASTVDEAAAAAGPPGPAASDAADTASVLGGEGPAEPAEPVVAAVDEAAASEQAVTADNAVSLPHPPTADAHEPDQVSQPAESSVSVSAIHPGSYAVDGACHPHDPAPAPVQPTDVVTVLDERPAEHPTPSATEHAAPPAVTAVTHVASVSHNVPEPKHVGQAIPAPAPEPVVAAVHENGLSSNRHVAVTPHVDVAVVAAAPSAPVAAVHTAGAQTNPEASHDSESAAAAAPSSTHAAAATAAAAAAAAAPAPRVSRDASPARKGSPRSSRTTTPTSSPLVARRAAAHHEPTSRTHLTAVSHAHPIVTATAASEPADTAHKEAPEAQASTHPAATSTPSAVTDAAASVGAHEVSAAADVVPDHSAAASVDASAPVDALADSSGSVFTPSTTATATAISPAAAAAAASAVEAMDRGRARAASSASSQPSLGGEETVEDELFEFQRRLVFWKDYSAGMLLPHENEFADRTGKKKKEKNQLAPQGWVWDEPDWRLDVNFKPCDANGWQYANDLTKDWQDASAPFRGIRRRRYVRVRKHVGRVDGTKDLTKATRRPTVSLRELAGRAEGTEGYVIGDISRIAFRGLRKFATTVTDIATLGKKSEEAEESEPHAGEDDFDLIGAQEDDAGGVNLSYNREKYLDFISKIDQEPSAPSLDAQHGKCHGCGSNIPIVDLEDKLRYARLCTLTNHYYCPSCHRGATHVIPWRIFRYGDLQKYPVCHEAASMLAVLYHDPLLSDKLFVPETAFASDRLLKFEHELRLIARLRTLLVSQAAYLFACPNVDHTALLKQLWPREHFMQSSTALSLADIVEIYEGTFNKQHTLPSKLQAMVDFCATHIRLCKHCETADNPLETKPPA